MLEILRPASWLLGSILKKKSGKKMVTKLVAEALGKAEAEVRSREEIDKRNACDKAFLAVIKAVDDFLSRRGYPIPRDHRERFKFLRELEEKDARVREMGIVDRLGARFHLAHELCFYGGEVEFAEDEVEKAKKLVEDLDRL
jgi:hypothetical protein